MMAKALLVWGVLWSVAVLARSATLLEGDPAAPQELGGASGADAAVISIDHAPVACVVADRYPTIGAKIVPSDEVSRARVFFRAAKTPHWYFVDMRSVETGFVATLPRPKADLRQMEYYVEALSRSQDVSQTAQFAARVVAGEAECGGGVAVAAIAGAGSLVALGVPAGAPAIPVGFAGAGILAAGSAPVAASAGAAAASSGGGVSPTLLWAGAGVAGAGVAGAALLASGGATEPRGPEWFLAVRISTDLSGSAIVGVSSVRFTAQGSDRDGGALQFHWDLGDGSRAEGEAVSHVYSSEGAFHVVLTGSSSDGSSATAEAEISVGSLTGGWYHGDGAGGRLASFQCLQNATSFSCRCTAPADCSNSYSGVLESPRLWRCEYVYWNGAGRRSGTGTVNGTLDRIDIAWIPSSEGFSNMYRDP